MSLTVFDPDDAADAQSLGGFRAEIWKEFGVEPLPQYSSRSEPAKRKRKREKVDSTVSDFIDLMTSNDAPETEAEMLAALTPVATWLLSWFVRQLVIQVLQACWKRWYA
jgi:hypothetical protein